MQSKYIVTYIKHFWSVPFDGVFILNHYMLDEESPQWVVGNDPSPLKRPMGHIALPRNSFNQQSYDYTIKLVRSLSPLWKYNSPLFVKTLIHFT